MRRLDWSAFCQNINALSPKPIPCRRMAAQLPLQVTSAKTDARLVTQANSPIAAVYYSSWSVASKIISAAVPHLPWLGENGKPLANVSAYAAQMDYPNIMARSSFSPLAASTPAHRYNRTTTSGLHLRIPVRMRRSATAAASPRSRRRTRRPPCSNGSRPTSQRTRSYSAFRSTAMSPRAPRRTSLVPSRLAPLESLSMAPVQRPHTQTRILA